MRSEWSLSEAARLLGQPQHRLIYLCEKGVVVPDFEDARGRGSSRRFSARNLLEFEVALKLRELTVPVTSIAAVLYALRAFETKVAQESEGFKLPDSLRTAGAPDISVIVTDPGRLYFGLSGRTGKKVYGGLDFAQLAASRRSGRRARPSRTRSPRLAFSVVGDERAEAQPRARLEVSLTKIAKDLDLRS